MSNSLLVPGAPAPALSIDTQHGRWTLAERKPDAFAVIFFYRGLHCPLCKKQLEELNGKMVEFTRRGLDVVAVSMDSQERWKETRDEWNIDNVTLGYGLSEDDARAWGLYISDAISEKEPAVFSEPGLFLVRPGGEVYMAAAQSAPFARPPIDDILSAVDFVTEKEYPPRGKRT